MATGGFVVDGVRVPVVAAFFQLEDEELALKADCGAPDGVPDEHPSAG